MRLKCACGNETNEADGVCRICKLFGNKAVIPAEAGIQKDTGYPIKTSGMTNKKTGGVKMAATGIKKCEKCSNEYKPTSNAQKYCADCGERINLEKTKNRKRNKIATPAAKVLPKPEIKVKEDFKSQIINVLVKQRDEHRHSLHELEAILNGISKYSDLIIPE